MTLVDQQQGSAGIQGELWGARARDWADLQEPQHRPLFEDGIRRTGIRTGSAVLDAGCGAGGFCRLAAQAGATVTASTPRRRLSGSPARARQLAGSTSATSSSCPTRIARSTS